MKRRVLEISVLVVLAFTVVILFLNHFEIDEYPEGMTAEEAAATASLPVWFPGVLAHPCVWCELCPHRFEVAESRLQVTVTDRDGWQRLFWAGAETHLYDDPALVGGALRNRTSEFSGGTWTIRGRFVPVDQPEPHPCPPAPSAIDLRYVLRRAAYPGPGVPILDASRMIAVPTRMLWFRYRYGDRVDEFWWELENAQEFTAASRTACDCSKNRP